MSLTRNRRLGLDGSTVQALFGKVPIPLVSATYGDALAPEWQANMGSQEQGERSRGSYSTSEVTLTMSSLVYRTVLAPLLPINGYGNLTFNLVISYVHPDLGDDSDLLEDCRIIGSDFATENTGKVFNGELKLSMSQLRLTDRRITINALDDVEETSENGLAA